jgi:hypothetical protein
MGRDAELDELVDPRVGLTVAQAIVDGPDSSRFVAGREILSTAGETPPNRLRMLYQLSVTGFAAFS